MSGKIFRAVLILALAVVAYATGNVLLGSFLLGQAIGTLAPNSIVAGIFAGILGGAAGVLGFFAARASAPKDQVDPGRDLQGRLNVRVNPNATREVIIGKAGTAGILAYRSSIEPANQEDPEKVWFVIVLAGHPITSIEEFKINGTTVTLPGGGGGAITSGTFANLLKVYYRLGDETTQAFPQIAASEGPNSTWGSKSRTGRGIAALAIEITADDVWKGKFEPVAICKGSKLYDPRLDTSVGGSGSHRWGNDYPSFAWSANSILGSLNYLRGFWIKDYQNNDVLIQGRGLKTDSTYIDFAHYIAEANNCDDAISVVGGGSIPRYEANGIIVGARPMRDELGLIDASHGGTTVFSSKYRTFPALWRAPTLTFSEEHIVGAPSRLDLIKGPADKINVVRGSIANADNGFLTVPYPPQKDAASIARVGERMYELSFAFITDHRQAQRVAKITMNRLNAKRKATCVLTHRGLRIAPGGTPVFFTYSHFDFNAEPMRCVEWGMQATEDDKGRPGLNVGATFIQDLESFYSWSVSDELSMEQPGRVPITGATPKLKSIPGSIASGDVQQEEGGVVHKLPLGATEGSGNDGDSIEFAQAWDSVPLIIFEPSGLKELAANEYYQIEAQNLTTTGFDISARIIGSGSGTLQTDTTEGTPTAPVDEVIDKGIATEADNDKYNVVFDVTAEDKVLYIEGEQEVIPGSVTLEFYIDKGAGWVLTATATYNSTGRFTKTLTVDGMNSTSHKFGIAEKSVTGKAGNGLDDIVEVNYTHGSGATNVTATPSGYGPINFKVIGGVEGGIATPVVGTSFTANTEELTLTAQAAMVGLNVTINAAAEDLTLTAQAAGVAVNIIVAQSANAALTLTAQQATRVFNVTVSGTTATLTLTAQAAAQAGLIFNIDASTQSLTLTPFNSGVSYNVTINAATEQLSLADQAATVLRDTIISAAAEELTLTGQQAFLGEVVSCATASTGAFNFVKYTGNADTIRLDNVGFAPEVVWIMRQAGKFTGFDDNLGTGKFLEMDNQGTAAEVTDANSILSFDSDGITIGSSSRVNASGGSFYVIFMRDVSGVFSHGTYTGNATNRTITHGLGGVPDSILVHGGSNDGGWYHKDTNGGVSPEDYYLTWYSAQAPNNDTTAWNSTAPTSTVFSLGTSAETNRSSQTFYFYCFKDDGVQCDVSGYTGNGSATGPTVTTGFQPRAIFQTSAESNGIEARNAAHYLAGSNAYELGRFDAGSCGLEGSGHVDMNATAFQLKTAIGNKNANGIDFIALTFGLKTT